MTLTTATHWFCRAASSNHSFTSQVKGDNPTYQIPLEMGSIFQSGPKFHGTCTSMPMLTTVAKFHTKDRLNGPTHPTHCRSAIKPLCIVERQIGWFTSWEEYLAGMVQQKYAISYKQLLARLLPTAKRPGESLGVRDISFHRNERGMLNDHCSSHLHLFSNSILELSSIQMGTDMICPWSQTLDTRSPLISHS